MKKHLRELDLLRSVAILAVLTAHLHDYVGYHFLRVVYPYAAHVGVTLFIFVSGYAVSLNSHITTWGEVKSFLARRMVRIYPLYILSLLTFALLFVPRDLPVSFPVHVVALQVLLSGIAEPYFTLWYMGLLIPFYVLFAVGRFCAQRRGTYVSVMVGIFAVFVVVGGKWGTIDARFFIYFIPFVFGAYLYDRGCLVRNKIRFVEVACLCGAATIVAIGYVCVRGDLALVEILGDDRSQKALKLISAVPISAGLLFVTQFVVKSDRIDAIARYLSYASFCVYLFHRQLLVVVKMSEPSCVGAQEGARLLLYLFVAYPAVVLLSSAIQRMADAAVLSRFSRHN